ncbi:MAG: polyphosphate kinase 1, partial [Bacteroidia bacterium]|nr:polyphosphate kinase 1 [Bacteroidia bacterium]
MIKDVRGYLFKDREISWMSFNERVLQEAECADTPLLEKLKFLAIFSSNNDEFFRVRVASLMRSQRAGKKNLISFPPAVILSEIQRVALLQAERFNRTYESILTQLADSGIRIVKENELNEEQTKAVIDYAKREVMPYLFPVLLDNLKTIPHLRDRSIYLAIRMSDSKEEHKTQHAIIEVPQSPLNRFFILPTGASQTHIMFLDDVIRTSLPQIFGIFDFDTFEAYTIKLTRDAEFIIDEDGEEIRTSLLEKIQKSLKQR